MQERANRLGVPGLSRNMQFWRDVQRQVQAEARPETEARSMEEVFDEQVIGSQHLGSAVLDFDSSE